MKITLSRRNLLSLLHKLEMRDSARTIVKYTDCEFPWKVYITAAPDEEVYADRLPGEMHPETEAFVSMLDRAIEQWRERCTTEEIDRENNQHQ
jgi:hypothetical protein